MKSEFRNWSDVGVFIAVAREGSTLAASRKLGMAQPTVARRIDVLEHELGVVLFSRDTRGFHLTETGNALLAKAEAVEEAAVEFGASARAASQARPIRVTAFSNNFSARAMKLFDEFAASHPGVTFDFLPDYKLLDLRKGEADVALRLTRTAPDPDLICRPISVAKYSIYGSSSYAEKWGLPTSPQEFAGHRFVAYLPVEGPGALFNWLSRHTERNQIVGSYRQFHLVEAAILSGTALGLMNLRLASGHPDLIRCFDPIEELNSDHLMLVSPEAWGRPEVRAFTKFFAPRYKAIFT